MKLRRNYFIVGIIYVLTILGVVYCISLYNSVHKFTYDDSVDMFVLDSSYDKMFSNVSNYMYENDKFVIFYSEDDSIVDLKNFIVDYDVSHSFLYLNNFEFFNRLLNDFSYDFSGFKNNKYFIYFSDGKIIEVVDCSSFDYNKFVKYFSKVGLI